MMKKPIPPDTLLAEMVEDSVEAGCDREAAEVEILRLCIRRWQGNVYAMSKWLGVQDYWLRRHLRYRDLWAEVETAKGV